MNLPMDDIRVGHEQLLRDVRHLSGKLWAQYDGGVEVALDCINHLNDVSKEVHRSLALLKSGKEVT